MINVRMQNDVKLPPAERRNYKNAIDGLIKVYRFEGPKALFNGASMATSRAIMMTIGQVSLWVSTIIERAQSHLSCSSVTAVHVRSNQVHHVDVLFHYL